MQPSEAAHSMKACWQNVLKKTAEELERFQFDSLPGSGATLAKRPLQAPVGQ